MQEEATYLAGRLADGDAAAFEEAYDLYGAGLYGYLLRLCGRREVAEDGLQEVMLRLVRFRERLAGVRSLRAWLYHVARNEGLRQVARRSVPHPMPPEPVEPVDEDATMLRRALARLSRERGEVVALKLHHGLTFAEIGEVLAISPNSAASRYRYALRDLRRHLETTDVER